MQMNQILTILNTSAPILGVVGVFILGVLYLRRMQLRDAREQEALWEERAQRRIELAEREQSARARAEGAIPAATASAPEEENGGFQYFKTDERHKGLFVDAFNGFKEFAALKGYSVAVAIDTGRPGMVGLKVTVIDIGVTVSTSQVRRDVNEYINKLNAEDDLAEMPVVTDPAEHARLVKAILARNDMLRHQASLNAYAATTYRGILDTVMGSPGAFRAISYQSPVPMHIQITNDGGKSMAANNTATNSPGAAVGSRNRAGIADSVVTVGATESERTAQVDAVQKLMAQIKASSLDDDNKAEALRYLANIKEEVAEDSPDSGRIAKWLKGAGEVINVGTAGAALAQKVSDVVNMFGGNS
jgi:hypothetical protein